MLRPPALLLGFVVCLASCARGATPPDPLDLDQDAAGEPDGADARPDATRDVAPDGAEPTPDMGAPDQNQDMPPDVPDCDTPYYVDADGDGHGAIGAEAVLGCEAPDGHSALDDDCDDAAPAVYPGAEEVIADGIDQDCDRREFCYVDADGDGVRAEPLTTVLVEDLTCTAEGLATGDAPEGDCDDDNPDVTTPGQEVCNGVDDDCNGVPDDGDTCPCPAVQRQGQTYLFCDQPSTWSQAQIFCQRIGQHLVKIETEEENDFLNQRAWAGGLDETWLGLNDKQTGGAFVWHDGTAPGYTNWNPGQPNNGDGGDQDCAELHTCLDPESCQDPSWAGKWNDEDCNVQASFICESP